MISIADVEDGIQDAHFYNASGFFFTKVEEENNMEKLRVIKIGAESIEFNGGVVLQSNHDGDCCERHYLSFEHITLLDFKDLVFDLSCDDFFKRITGYGIELIPIKGHSIKVPGYGFNNGYYGTNIDLQILKNGKLIKSYDVTECQTITD